MSDLEGVREREREVPPGIIIIVAVTLTFGFFKADSFSCAVKNRYGELRSDNFFLPADLPTRHTLSFVSKYVLVSKYLKYMY